jgi:dTMP kinase
MRHPSERGLFVTLEGIEGAGKSTVATQLVAALVAAGQRVCATREPGGTPLAERVRAIVLESREERISPEIETLLMFAARGIHLDNKIRPALLRGECVVCDRFTDATRAYQGGGRGVSNTLIESLARTVHDDISPDLTLLLDVPVSLGLSRARARRGDADRIEGETARFFERVRTRYLELAVRDAKRIRIVDASQSLEQVCDDARAVVLEVLGARARNAAPGAAP